MSRKKDDQEMGLIKAKMALRRFVNLKHSIAAREELNELEPELEEKYWAAINAGAPFEFDLKQIAERVEHAPRV